MGLVNFRIPANVYISGSGQFTSSLTASAISASKVFGDGSGLINVNSTFNPASNISLNDGVGIVFGTVKTAKSGSVSSQTLNDYETGTWTPSISGSTSPSGATVTHVQRTGRYHKVGRLVTIEFCVAWTSIGTSTGPLKIINLPYAPSGYGTQVTDNYCTIPVYSEGSHGSAYSNTYVYIDNTSPNKAILHMTYQSISLSTAPVKSNLNIYANGDIEGIVSYYTA